MSETKFTPGPWEVHTSGMVRRCEGDFCCAIAEPRMPYRKGVSHSRGFREEWHNMRLIAAAPELYAAVERAADLIHKHAPGLEHVADDFERLLSKARGSALSPPGEGVGT